MSLKPQTGEPVPAETARVAKVAFPQGNVYMQMRDVFGTFHADDAFAPLFSPGGQLGMAPACLALVRCGWPSGHERKHANRLLQR